MPFYVYELYDLRAGWILYVGSTRHGLGLRLCNHRGNPNELLKLWADEAGWDTIGIRAYKECSSRQEMLDVERHRIIESEAPFNINRGKGNTTKNRGSQKPIRAAKSQDSRIELERNLRIMQDKEKNYQAEIESLKKEIERLRPKNIKVGKFYEYRPQK